MSLLITILLFYAIATLSLYTNWPIFSWQRSVLPLFGRWSVAGIVGFLLLFPPFLANQVASWAILGSDYFTALYTGLDLPVTAFTILSSACSSAIIASPFVVATYIWPFKSSISKTVALVATSVASGLAPLLLL